MALGLLYFARLERSVFTAARNPSSDCCRERRGTLYVFSTHFISDVTVSEIVQQTRVNNQHLVSDIYTTESSIKWYQILINSIQHYNGPPNILAIVCIICPYKHYIHIHTYIMIATANFQIPSYIQLLTIL